MAIIDKYTKNLPLSVGLSRHSYRHLIFSPNTTEEIFKKHLLITYKGLKYVKNRLSKPSVQYLKQKEVRLNKVQNYYKKHKKTLILDLDETIIHS